MCLSNILRVLVYVSTSLSICLIGVYTGLERGVTNDSNDCETQSGAGFANSTMQAEAYSSDFETQSGAGFANSSMQDQAGFSDSVMQVGAGFAEMRIKPILSKDDPRGADWFKKDMHLRCIGMDYTPKKKVVNIFRCIPRLTDKQRREIKDLVHRFELMSEINCTSNGELICKNKHYKNSNIYELMSYSIYKICCKNDDELSTYNDDSDYIAMKCEDDDDISVNVGYNRLKRKRNDCDVDSIDSNDDESEGGEYE